MILWDDLLKYKGVIPQEHLPALGRDLKKIPDFSWLISTPHKSLERLQGDVINNLPTVFLDGEGNPQKKQFPVMVINNTCDLPDGRLDSVTVAPLLDFNDFIEWEKTKRSQASLDSYVHEIRNNKKTELIFLPKFAQFQSGAIVLLHLVCSISANIYLQALKKGERIASFTQTGFYFLLIKLTLHLSRLESSEIVR